MKINVQMYSFMDGSERDSRENLSIASEIGFDGVELFGPDLAIPVDEMKTLLNELKLTPVSMHAPKTAAVEELVPYAKSLGMNFIGIGMEIMRSEDEVHQFAATLNRIGEACSKEGLRLTYHNHTQEFASYGQKMIMDILAAETNPEFVSFELDAGWCAAAGVDPVEFIKKHSGRIKLVHIKESSRVIGPQPPMEFDKFEKDEKGRPIFPDDVKKLMDEHKKINCSGGEGIVDWKVLTETALANGCEHFIVERENTVGESRIEDLKKDLAVYHKICD